MLDTDVVSRLLRGSLADDVAERLTGAVLLLTFVTVGELFAEPSTFAGDRGGSPP